MKKHLLMWMTLFVACSIFVAPGASTLFAKSGHAWAQGRSGGPRGPEPGKRGRRDKQEQRGKKENRGHRKKWEREPDGRYRFNDYNRHAVDVYYRDHRSEFRQRWRGAGPPIAYGYVIERPYRRYCRPVPVVLLRELPPPPPGFRFFLLGGNVVLLDDGYRVQDFIHVDINFGR